MLDYNDGDNFGDNNHGWNCSPNNKPGCSSSGARLGQPQALQINETRDSSHLKPNRQAKTNHKCAGENDDDEEVTSPTGAAIDTCPPDLMASLQLFQVFITLSLSSVNTFINVSTWLFNFAFQQQRMFHTRRLRREMKKLEKMEREIAIRTAAISVPPPEPKPRQCWTEAAANAKTPSKIPIPQSQQV